MPLQLPVAADAAGDTHRIDDFEPSAAASVNARVVATRLVKHDPPVVARERPERRRNPESEPSAADHAGNGHDMRPARHTLDLPEPGIGRNSDATPPRQMGRRGEYAERTTARLADRQLRVVEDA